MSKIQSDFDVKFEHSNERFTGNIELPENWQIGVIVGASGTGKTTIAKEIFSDCYVKQFEYKSDSVVDDMPDVDMKTIERMFYAVGFGSVPSWLKPYAVLSNGEKMRVDLARALLQSEKVCFDEFTSVVDRNVAQTMCIATRKAINRTNKQFVAVTCHFDVIDWIEPDWVFNTDTMKMVFPTAHGNEKNMLSKFRHCKNKQAKIDFRCGREEWEKFRRYHYLNSDLPSACVCYGLYEENNIIGFIGVLHQPHSRNRKLKRVSRLVILPDYQGIGLGTKFLNVIAEHYKQEGFDFRIVTSAKNMINALNGSEKWKMIRWSVNRCNNNKSRIDNNRKSMRDNCMTGGFRYV